MCTPDWELVRFVLTADPERMARLGAKLPDGATIVDLQAGHFAMRGAPSPHFRDTSSFRLAGAHAADVADEVVDWVTSQRPPGTTARVDDVRIA